MTEITLYSASRNSTPKVPSTTRYNKATPVQQSHTKINNKFDNYLLGLIFWYDIIVRLKHVLESTAAYI